VLVGAQGRLANDAGRPLVMGVLQDITEKRRLQENELVYRAKLERSMLGTAETVARMVELRDPYTAGHERRVGEIAAAIAKKLGWDTDRQEGLRIAGSVHDVGKITVPSEILTKPGRLSSVEFELVKTHAQQGYEVLKDIDFPWPIAEVARQHHERMNGSGYPRGLKGKEILPEARVLAVADVVESMASHRPYRPALGIDEALQEIERNSAKLYDPDAADVCIRMFREDGFALPR
jgi:HD-GYP domain-containing protein (c-di-GMP phosphodiesterase class II)